MEYTPEQLADIQDKYVQAQTRLQAVNAEADQKNNDISRLVREIVAKEKQLRSFTEQVEVLEPRVQSLHKEISDAGDKKNALAIEIDRMQSDQAKKHAELTEHEQQVRESIRKSIQLSNDIAQRELEAKEREDVLKDRQNRIEESTKQIIEHLNAHIQAIK